MHGGPRMAFPNGRTKKFCPISAVELWEGGENFSRRGGKGPLTTHRTAATGYTLVNAYLEAGTEAGFPFNPDYNGAEQEGFARGQLTTRMAQAGGAARQSRTSTPPWRQNPQRRGSCFSASHRHGRRLGRRLV